MIRIFLFIVNRFIEKYLIKKCKDSYIQNVEKIKMKLKLVTLKRINKIIIMTTVNLQY